MSFNLENLPQMPLSTVALEPEKQVGFAAVTTGYPHIVVMHKCAHRT
tara:strand:+ start:162 stop:302 length:141 start_codon:yes stop_codon:yes gene_type:complete